MLGTIELDVDWAMPVEHARAKLRDIVATQSNGLSDGGSCVLQVADAVGGSIRLRALVSAANGSQLWDVRCLVREQMVAWVQANEPAARPLLRAEVGVANGVQADGHTHDGMPRSPTDVTRTPTA